MNGTFPHKIDNVNREIRTYDTFNRAKGEGEREREEGTP